MAGELCCVGFSALTSGVTGLYHFFSVGVARVLCILQADATRELLFSSHADIEAGGTAALKDYAMLQCTIV